MMFGKQWIARDEKRPSSITINRRGSPAPSNTRIIKDLLTKEKIYNDVPDILYLLSHCMMKTVNEAVVESMGCTVDQHANEGRHLSNNKYSMEAMIHRNGPPLHLADSLIKTALDRYFARREKVLNGQVVTRTCIQSHITVSIFNPSFSVELRPYRSKRTGPLQQQQER
jgi:hypothetical protein